MESNLYRIGGRFAGIAARTLLGALTDPAALAEARAGARRAREELTWDAAARAHLAIYEEIA